MRYQNQILRLAVFFLVVTAGASAVWGFATIPDVQYNLPAAGTDSLAITVNSSTFGQIGSGSAAATGSTEPPRWTQRSIR